MSEKSSQDGLISTTILELCKCLRPIIENKSLKQEDRLRISFIAISEMVSHFRHFLNEIGLEISYEKLLEQFKDIQTALDEHSKEEEKNQMDDEMRCAIENNLNVFETKK